MGYKCPYCGEYSVDNESKLKQTGVLSFALNSADIFWKMMRCANCGEISFSLSGVSNKWSRNIVYSYPPMNAKVFPNYVPAAIHNDYLEASSILQHSPKAAATLARRCLQGMIHDYWGIKEKNLNAEITMLKGKIPTSQWNAIDALRKLGNIGAHMEKDVDRIIDVDPQEAEKLLKLIELLVDKWYVARHDEETLLQEIAELGDQKEAERKA